jgi:hypothetical protein
VAGGEGGGVIHYHGGPITPLDVALTAWEGRHAFVSFENPEQVALAAKVCQSFALDNGAFSKWTQGGTLDVPAYVAWVQEWERHPGFDFALIPDVIDGDETENDRMFATYHQAGGNLLAGVPVWHLHESFERLARLCRTFPRVALGSSGQWSEVGTAGWWQRMGAAMDFICDDEGRPPCKLHGLRMLNPEVFSCLPLSSADSTNAARNHARTRKRYALTKRMAALVMVHDIETRNSAACWERKYGADITLDLVS